LPSPPQTDVTELLSAVSAGRAHAADELLPLVYEELRNLAQAQMAREPSGHTLQRLVKPGSGQEPAWDSRAHFFASAALAMRRILVERARRVAGPKRGGGRVQALGDRDTPAPTEIDLVGLDEALKKFEAHDARKYQVVMLKFFAGLSIEQIAAAKLVCRRCEVQGACLEFALATNQDSGVWGGTSEEERRKLRKQWVARQRRSA